MRLYDVACADEAFFTSTAFSMLPCTKTNGLLIGDGKPGPIFARLIDAWSEEVGVDIIAQTKAFAAEVGALELGNQHVSLRQAGCAAMKYEMTSRDRMLAAIRRQPVDHIPLGQLFHSTVWRRRRTSNGRNQFERARVMKDLGLDPVIDIWMPAPEAPPEIPVRKWMEDDPDGPDALLCAEYETPAGKLVQKVRRTDGDWYRPDPLPFSARVGRQGPPRPSTSTIGSR